MFPLFVPQVLEHETSDGCDKSKAAAVKLNGTLGPSTVTGHGPGMPIDVDGPADAATTALAASLDAALAATATQQSGNSGADSKRKRRELGPAVELPGAPPAASPDAGPTVGSKPSTSARSSRLLTGETKPCGTFLRRLRESIRARNWCRCASASHAWVLHHCEPPKDLALLEAETQPNINVGDAILLMV